MIFVVVVVVYIYLFSFGKVTNPQLLLPPHSDFPQPLCPKLSPSW